ncbi:MAG: MFS transporter [Saprospiraceae bacterium]|nr:MFS transporter [Saprospiraceae bacterium]
MKKEKIFTPYETFVIAILAILQFTIILDFMVLSPLGAILLPTLNISTAQFGTVVSAYAFSAGASGFLAAGFADKYDRKSFLLFFYVGFIIGTLLCAMAPTYETLLAARIITGIFGGVIGSVGFAIITDLFSLEVRGRVMGYVQMAFGASQVLGLPIGLYLANAFGWHAPFWMIVGVGIIIGLVIWKYLQPIKGHIAVNKDRNVFSHLTSTLSHPFYINGYLSTILLATGGFMLMPFGSAFATNNLGLTLDQLPLLYLITGLFTIFAGPVIGRFSDKIGKFNMFAIGSTISIFMVGIYTNLGVTPLWICIALNVILFIGINARIISISALTSAIPEPKDRGAYMSINASIQQVSGGIASSVAGLIVVQQSDGMLTRYDTLGIVVIVSMVIALGMVYWLDRLIKNRNKTTSPVPQVNVPGLVE